MTRPSPGSEHGSGALSTVFGVGVFLVMLYTCSHILLNLWLTSAVDAVAHDAATDVATSGASDAEMGAAEDQAIARARVALGGYGNRVTFAFQHEGGDTIVLRVRARELELLPPLVAHLAGRQGYDRRVIVEREADD